MIDAIIIIRMFVYGRRWLWTATYSIPFYSTLLVLVVIMRALPILYLSLAPSSTLCLLFRHQKYGPGPGTGTPRVAGSPLSAPPSSLFYVCSAVPKCFLDATHYTGCVVLPSYHRRRLDLCCVSRSVHIHRSQPVSLFPTSRIIYTNSMICDPAQHRMIVVTLQLC